VFSTLTDWFEGLHNFANLFLSDLRFAPQSADAVGRHFGRFRFFGHRKRHVDLGHRVRDDRAALQAGHRRVNRYRTAARNLSMQPIFPTADKAFQKENK
jgi:hypothetical protein